MNIHQRISILALSLVVSLGWGCNKEEAPNASPDTTEEMQTIELNVRINAGVSMPDELNYLDDNDEMRAGGLQLKYKNGVPYFRMMDSHASVGGDAILSAYCVFKKKRLGTDELDESSAMYGWLSFKVKDEMQTDPKIDESGGKVTKVHPVQIISEGNVILKAPRGTQLKANDEWYVMGFIGGKPKDDDPSKVDVLGYAGILEDNGQVSGIDDYSSKGGASVPFLSNWVKMTVIQKNTGMELAAEKDQRMDFKFQGMLLCLDIKNDTGYRLQPYVLSTQSTQLTSQIQYDLNSSNKVSDSREVLKWSNTAQTSKRGTWIINHYSLGGVNNVKYYLDPKSSSFSRENRSFLYDSSEPKKDPSNSSYMVSLYA